MPSAQAREASSLALEGRLVNQLARVVDTASVSAAGDGPAPRIVLGDLVLCVAWDETTRTYEVQTLEGEEFRAAEGGLEDCSPPAPEDGGFDLLWPSGLGAPLGGGPDGPSEADFGALFGRHAAQALSERGYVVAQAPLLRKHQEEAFQAAGSLPPLDLREELAEDVLGSAPNSMRALRLPPDVPDRMPEHALAACDRAMTEAGVLLQPYAATALGFTAVGRSPGIVRIAHPSRYEAQRAAPEPLDIVDQETGVIEDHLMFVRRRKVCMIFLIDNDGGQLVLFDGSGRSVTIPLSRNKLVIFRHDLLRYEYRPQGSGLAVQSWMMGPEPTFELARVEGPMVERDQALDITGVPRPAGPKAQMLSAATRFPAFASTMDEYATMVYLCTDAATVWPISRCDLDLYYSPESDFMNPKSYTNHGSWVDLESAIALDNKFFGIPDEEATCLSLNQRMILEVGYQTLYLAGWTRSKLNGAKIGTYLGDVGSDWHSLTAMFSWRFHEPMLCATSLTSSVVPARLAFVFNMKGPTMTFDTACSASLVATHHGHMDQINHRAWGKEDDGALCGGVNTLAEPGYVGNCMASMLSHIGRCFTFDRTADGYQRGEGAGCFFLKLTEDDRVVEERMACLAGTCANQDGRSASLTAPNGPSQQAVIRASLRMSSITTNDVAAVECHGTGTALGDPIEVGALLAVMEKGRDRPLPHTSAKSNISHLESAAGVAGILKCAAILLHAAATPNVHLRAMNAHLATAGFPQLFETEITDIGANSGFMGVSSFGFGGTNSRGDLYAKADIGPRKCARGYEHAKLDIVAAPCPKCMGQMCWMCGVAIPTYSEKSKHKCSLVREVANYDYCSECYEGGYRYGASLGSTLQWEASYRVGITGTCNGWQVDELDHETDGIYSGLIMLGDTRREQFQLVVNGNRENVLYPACALADQSARVVGPEACGRAQSWLVDGFADGAHEGDLYRVTFEWGDKLRVSWQLVPAEERMDVNEPVAYHSRYFIVGSFTRWAPQEMVSDRADPHLHLASFSVGSSSFEEFQIRRERDVAQAIHPAFPGPAGAGAPIRGPDAGGHGKHWQVAAPRGEVVTVQLRVQDGEVSLEASGETIGTRAWSSGAAQQPLYYVTASFNNWGFSQMNPDEQDPRRQRLKVYFDYAGVAEFQVVLDADWAQRMYPRRHGQAPGQDFVQGPDAGGDGINWHVPVEPGATYEIVVEAGAEDRRKHVSWSLIPDERGSALMNEP